MNQTSCTTTLKLASTHTNSFSTCKLAVFISLQTLQSTSYRSSHLSHHGGKQFSHQVVQLQDSN